MRTGYDPHLAPQVSKQWLLRKPEPEEGFPGIYMPVIYILTQSKENVWMLMYPNLEFQMLTPAFAYQLLESPDILFMEELL